MIEVETIEGKYHIGKVIVDEAPQTPREWDNLGVMACFHGKYSLPNETDLKTEMFSSWDEMEKHIIKELGAIVILPMYMMDHSGLAVSVKQYSCPWDSGQIGFVFVTEEILKNEYGDAGEKSQEKARTVMEAEVETYSQYLNGDVYGYEIYERCPECGHESECVDSCWATMDSHRLLEK